MDAGALGSLGIAELDRGTLPDVVAYEKERNWLFLIEAVHSSNPINQMRHLTLRKMTEATAAGRIFISAFKTPVMFARFSKEISRETEEWIVDQPDHMIHFDGGRFLAPHESTQEGGGQPG